MHKAPHYSNSISVCSVKGYMPQLMIVMSFIALLFISTSSFARENNPGSNLTCTAGSTKGFLSDGSYSNLVTSFTNNSYQNVVSETTSTGSTNANIPLKIKMSIADVGINSTGNNTTITGTTANPAIDINRNFTGEASRSDITLDFQNGNNSEVTYLDKVALSVFDIDKSVSRGSGWDDLVKITGVTENDGTIEGTFQTIPNSIVTKLTNGLQTSSTSNNFNCTSALESACQGSVLFDKPVKSVTIRYSNTSIVTSPTTQRIQFRLDSYCYTPQYTFLGFVFNDNAGIAENNSSNLESNTKSNVSSTFTGNAKYFNGLFDSDELGISAAGLTVSLTNCNSAGTPIAGTTAQTVAANPLGEFKFTVPANVIASLTSQKVCLVQNEPSGWEFSVDTTPNSREVTLVAGTFDYKTESNGSRNLDFGEVKSNYAALVLKKSQYVHTCNPTINFTSVPANPQPNTPINGFSANSATNVTPGQCIAYRIEAFNRGHVDLQKVQISDILQTTPVASVFSLPRPLGTPTEVYASGKPAPIYGQNGTITSSEFNLNKVPTGSATPTKATLFFNTKYGTTVNP